jgi:hypothetical protein
LELLSQETLEMLKKASGTQYGGIFGATGAYGLDLSGLTSLVPVNTPARNNTSAFPREIAGMGAPVATWRTWVNINSAQYSGNVGVDYAGSATQFKEQDVYAPYLPIAKFGRATLDAVAFGRNYIDAVSQAELQTLNQVFLCQDMNIINSQNWTLFNSSVPGTPTGTGSQTGGSLASATYYVAVAARSGANYFDGGSSLSSVISSGIVIGGSVTAGSLSVSVPGGAVKGAVAYDWYIGTTSAATSLWYSATTTTSAATLTVAQTAKNSGGVAAVLAAAGQTALLPLINTGVYPGHGVNPIPNVSGTGGAGTPTSGNGNAPTSGAGDTDLSGNPNYYNGVIASSLGDYGATGPTTPGAGVTPSGATYLDWGGGSVTAVQGSSTVVAGQSAIPLLDSVNQSLWQNVQLSPTSYMMNSLQAQAMSNSLRGSAAAVTFLPPTDADARTNLVAGGFVGRYINVAAGGVPVNIEVHPRVAPGTIIARTDRVPFPGSNIGTVFSVRCQYDTMRFDYSANYNPGVSGGGPRYDFEVRSNETLVNTAPVAQAVISNCF